MVPNASPMTLKNCSIEGINVLTNPPTNAVRIEFSLIAAAIPLVAERAGAIALLLVTLFVSLLSIVLGELIPKGFALANADRIALVTNEIICTEAGFGADMGAEKFFDIKCRKAGLKPDCAVLVATIRALKMHGGVAKDDLKKENLDALKKGLSNLQRHVTNVQKYGVPVSSSSVANPYSAS